MGAYAYLLLGKRGLGSEGSETACVASVSALISMCSRAFNHMGSN
jgi:hypothetical protein